MQEVEALAAEVGVAAACSALALPRATFYRHRRTRSAPPARAARPAPPLALSDSERQEVLAQLHSPRFVDAAPRQVFNELLDEGIYLCSVRTMHRILAADGESAERRNQCQRPAYQKPELLATAPNQVWSWDITKLKGPSKWSYFCLYVILDIFSRYVVGWMLADRESKILAQHFIAETLDKQKIQPGQLTFHADRGACMTAKDLADFLDERQVYRTHSRPYTSNDNPYSEAFFKTLKYHPSFPERFGCFEDAKAYCAHFFTWYNTQHRHSGIAMLTPEQVHYGDADRILEQRAQVLEAAYQAIPHRFKGRRPKPAQLPEAAWINPPPQAPGQEADATDKRKWIMKPERIQ